VKVRKRIQCCIWSESKERNIILYLE